MADYRMSNIIIAAIVVSGLAALLMGLLGHAAVKNDLIHDNSTLANYDKLQELNDQTEEIKNREKDIQRTGILDILGDFFQNGYAMLRLTRNSYDTIDAMSDSAVEDLNLGYGGRTIKIVVASIIVVVIFLGIITTILVKWPS